MGDHWATVGRPLGDPLGDACVCVCACRVLIFGMLLHSQIALLSFSSARKRLESRDRSPNVLPRPHTAKWLSRARCIVPGSDFLMPESDCLVQENDFLLAANIIALPESSLLVPEISSVNGTHQGGFNSVVGALQK